MAASSDAPFTEVGDRCFVARYPEWDVNVGLVLGADGALVVDTRASAEQGAAIREDARKVAPHQEVRWVVNTHQHFDHTFGNIAMAGARVVAHERAAAGLETHAARIKALIAADPSTDPEHPAITVEVLEQVLATPLRHPDVTFAAAYGLDLGDRVVELRHLGRGHTDGDLLLVVPDADVVFAGDLVEEAGPPSFGEDSFPLDWGSTLARVAARVADATVVVPGHGMPVDRAFVARQAADVARAGQLIESVAAQGVPVERAATEIGADWPFPDPPSESAIGRGYWQLARSGHR